MKFEISLGTILMGVVLVSGILFTLLMSIGVGVGSAGAIGAGWAFLGIMLTTFTTATLYHFFVKS